jgi:hypothetical protein
MPSHLKKLVKARMAETGEGYQAALRHVRSQAPPRPPQPPPPWCVVCRDCPSIVHARDDGHVCVDPKPQLPEGATL